MTTPSAETRGYFVRALAAHCLLIMSKLVSNCFLLFVALALITGCATKASLKSRSEVLSRGNQDLPVQAIIAKENEEFLNFEKQQRARLRTLLETRSVRSRDMNYRIGSQDELQLSVFDVPELQGTFRVSHLGSVSLPLVGEVRVAGLTENQAMQLIAQNLSRFVRRPQVTLAVANFSSQQVAVLGAVNRPGNQQLRKGVNTLIEVISLAGGVKEKAGNFLTFVPQDENIDRGKYALEQAEGRAPTIGIDIPLDQIMGTSGGLPLDIEVRGGDIVIVPEAGRVSVEGEVDKAGGYDLGTQMSVLTAIAAAGGITYSANTREIEVIRDIGFDKKLHLVLDLQAVGEGTQADVRVRNGDIIRVPTDSGRRMTQDVFEGLSRIVNFGIGGTVNVAR